MLGRRCVAFDLEGPLSPEDAAFDLMGRLIPQEGRRIFQAISRYDDILALSGRAGYEPGDTLALIVPFLVLHGLDDSNIAALAEEATLVDGAVKVIRELRNRGYHVFDITSSYEQYALPLTTKLGLSKEHVASTTLPLEKLREDIKPGDLELVKECEASLLTIDIKNEEEALKELLDEFFWERLPRTSLGEAIALVKPLGGTRKLGKLEAFAVSVGQRDISHWAAVGDSITDNVMLRGVRDRHGLAIAFNANRYALEEATVGVACRSLEAILPLLGVWEEGGLRGAHRFVLREAKPPDADGPHYHWLAGADIDEALVVHARFRKAVRQAAGTLG